MSQYLNDIANQSQMLQAMLLSSRGGNANLVDVLPTEKYEIMRHTRAELC